MAPSPRDGRDRALIAAVARRFYLEDRSKVQIADELGISRFKVARLITAARERGVVRIEIAPEAGLDEALADRLRARLGLRRCAVVDLPTSDDEHAGTHQRQEVGRIAAHLLASTLTERDVLGLPWSRTVAAMVLALPQEHLPPVPVVQLSGALTVADVDATPVDVVRETARITGGAAHHFYAPLVATDPASAQVLRRQPSVADAGAHVAEVTVAVAGVGAWAPEESTLYGLLTPAEQRAVRDAGAVGEISGAFIDRDGHAVESSTAERFITVSAAQLAGIDHVIGLATGAARATVVRAGVRGGLLSSLVCDRALAEALLADGAPDADAG